MALPFARFTQLLKVATRNKQKDQKFIFQQFVFLAHWIYLTIEQPPDAERLSMVKFLKMYGLITEEEEALSKELRKEANEAERLQAHKNAEEAQRRFTGQ